MTEEAVLSQCQRADSYKILAECFYAPDEKLIKNLVEFGKARAGIFEELITAAPRPEKIECHLIDYSKLFLGPFKLLAPLYGSFYLEDGKLMGDSATAVKEFYEQEGLDIVLKDSPDHVSAELEFLYFLSLKQAEALENSDQDEASRLAEKQASFLRLHLGNWIESFAEKIQANAETEFYKVLGCTTCDFVLEDLRKLTG